MSVLDLVPGLLSMAALVIAPGLAMLRVLGVRGVVALGAAAPVTFAVGSGGAVVCGFVGIPWGLPTVLVGMLLAVGVCAWLGRLLGTGPWGRRDVVQPGPLPQVYLLLAVAATTLAGLAYAAALANGIGDLARPSQVWDGVFHLSAIEAIREHGDASTFGGLVSLYDYGYAPVYPAGYHGLVAVVPLLADASLAMNASILLAGPLLALSSAALVRAVWPGLPAAAAVAGGLSTAFLALPTGAVTQVAQMPYAYAHVLLPGVLALVVLAIRNLDSLARLLACALPAGVAALGLALVHGSAWFTLALLLGPLLLAVAVRSLARTVRVRRTRGQETDPRADGSGAPTGPARAMPVWGAAAWAAIGITALAALPLLREGALAVVRAFPRAGREDYEWILTSLLVDGPLRSFDDYGLGGPVSIGQVALLALVLAGGVVVWFLRAGRWLAVGLVSSAALTVLAAGPADHPLRVLAGPWYTEPSRLAAIIVVCAIPLASVAVGVIARVASPRATASVPAVAPRHLTGAAASGRRYGIGAGVAAALLVTLLVATGGWRYELRRDHAVESFVPNHLAFRMLADDAELDLMRNAAEILPEDAVVLGDRFRGTPYFYSLGGVDVVYPHLAGPRSADRAYLLATIDQIGTDPEVCRIISDLGVTHFWTNTRKAGKEPWQQMIPLGADTMYYLRPGEGFELIATAGTGELYEITACRGLLPAGGAVGR
ncbi:MAG: DUF6541 family protein [Actinomycetaceae bacterium]